MNQLPSTATDTTTPATRDQINQALALLNSLPRRSVESDQGALNVEAYHIALAGCTRYGLNIATQKALKGMHGSAFFPSPAEMATLHSEAMTPVYAQKRMADEIEAQRQERERLDAVPRGMLDEAAIRRKFSDNPQALEMALHGTPIGRHIQARKHQFRNHRIIKRDLTLEQFRRGKWPVGATYVPILETVFLPQE